MRRRFMFIQWMLFLGALSLAIPAMALDGGANPFPDAPPASLGVDPANLQYICDEIQKWVDAKEVVGAEVHIIKERRTILHKSFGMKDQERNLPMVNDTIFCVRSMTKPVVGTVVQEFIGWKRIGLDDPAAKYLKSFDNDKSRGITIRQLLTHTSGLPLTLIDKSLNEYHGIRDIADAAGAHGPDFEPGSRFQYSDEGADALGAIIEGVTGQPLDDVVRLHVLEPCGMNDAITTLKKDNPKLARVAPGYLGVKGSWEKFWDNNGDSVFPFLFASQGLYCTTTDYAKFMQMWMHRGAIIQGDTSRRTITDTAVERALMPVSRFTGCGFDNYSTWYGQLWEIYRPDNPPEKPSTALPIFGHSGSDGTNAIAFPEQDMIALYFSQSRGGTTAIKFEELLRPLIGQPRKNPDAAAASMTLEQMEPLVGFYHLQDMDSFAYVLVQDGRLAIEIPEQTVFALKWPNAEGKWEFELLNGAFIKFDPPPQDAAGRSSPGLTVYQNGMEIKAPRYMPAGDLPTVDQLIALRQASQGEDHLKALRNYRLTGEVHYEKSKKDGKVTLLIDGANRFDMRIDIGGGFERTLVSDGKAWSESSAAPIAEQTGVVGGQKMRAFQAYRLGTWRDWFKDIQVLRRGKTRDEPTIIVRAAPAVSNALRIVVDEKTGLTLAEYSFPLVKGVGVLSSKAVYEDYRAVQGVQIPFRVISDTPLIGRITMQFDTVETNLDLAADAFAPTSSTMPATAPK